MANLHPWQNKTRGQTGFSCLVSAFAVALVSTIGPQALAQTGGAANSACPGDNGGITLSPGFCATVFADNLGHVRQMAIAPNGVLYANTWSGRYYRNDTPPPGGFLIALKDKTGTGRADVIERFGPGVPQGSAGGTGVALYNGYVYAEENDKIVRYKLPTDPNSIAPRNRLRPLFPVCR